jgi:rubredoxin
VLRLQNNSDTTVIMLCINIFIRRNKLMKYVCDVCGWEYDEEEGYPEGGIAPGTKWEDVPEDFECPLCNVGKDQFSEVE